MPEYGFNGIGDFTPGFGYQIKLTEAIEGFSLCDWYVNHTYIDSIFFNMKLVIMLMVVLYFILMQQDNMVWLLQWKICRNL